MTAAARANPHVKFVFFGPIDLNQGPCLGNG